MNPFQNTLRLLILTSLLYLSTTRATPIITQTQFDHLYKRDVNLGNGRSFILTSPASLFMPLQPAAAHLELLYSLTRAKAAYAASLPLPERIDVAAVAFRVGAFSLIIEKLFDLGDSGDSNEFIDWSAVDEFCDLMLDLVRHGQVLYYDGVIKDSKDTGDMVVRLRLTSELG